MAWIETGKPSTKLKAKLVDDQVKVTISIKVKGILNDQVLHVPGRIADDPKEDPELYEKLGTLVEKKFKSDVQKLVSKAQIDLNADIFGVGDYLRNRYPSDWERVKFQWYDYYKKAEIDVNVKASIGAPGILMSRLPMEDAAEKSETRSGEE